MNIQTRIQEIEQQRHELQQKLKSEDISDIDTFLDELYQKIAAVSTVEDTDLLIKQYGPVQQLVTLRDKLIKRDHLITKRDLLSRVALAEQDPSFELLHDVHAQLVQVHDDDLLLRFDTILVHYKQTLVDTLSEELVNSRWDTETGHIPEQAVTTSSRLAELQKMYPNDVAVPWNMEALASSFRIKFTYHFKEIDVDLVFSFTEKYLRQTYNKSLVFGAGYINAILDIVSLKLRPVAQQADIKLLIVLIAKVSTFDLMLSDTFHFSGTGLMGIIDEPTFNKWCEYEIETCDEQLDKILSCSARQAEDFDVLLTHLFQYLEPVFKLHGNLNLKLSIFNRIFLGSLSRFRDQTGDLYIKLENLNRALKLIDRFETELVFIQLCDAFNSVSGNQYMSLFEEARGLYEDAKELTLKQIMSQVKREVTSLMKDFLKKTWTIHHDPSVSSEIVSTLQYLTTVINKVPKDTVFYVTNEMQNIIVHFFIDYIIKLNKFSPQGLEQLVLDYDEFKKILGCSSYEDKYLMEIISLMKTGASGTSREIREKLHLKYLSDQEISDIIYRTR